MRKISEAVGGTFELGGLRVRLRGREFRVLDAVSKYQAAGERFDALDLGWNEKRRLSGREWRGYVNEGI
jgi:hypothetical protein